MNRGTGCGICEMPHRLGAFQGQYTDDAQPGHDAWRWRFAAGQILFSTEPIIAVDGSTELPYCGLCGQDMREARGLASDVPVHVSLLHN